MGLGVACCYMRGGSVRTSDKPLARRLLMSSRRDSDHGVGVARAVLADMVMSVMTVFAKVEGRIAAVVERRSRSEEKACQKE